MRSIIGAIFGTFVLTAGTAWPSDPPVWRPVVKSEQVVYRYRPADNGASPMWCRGSTCLVRIGDDVWATGLEAIPNAKPLNNCRWTLWQRHAGEWKQVYRDEQHRTREPSPLVGFPDGRLLVSANPTLAPPDAYSGPARPEIYVFSANQPANRPRRIEPPWNGTPDFTEHSYRTFVADAHRGDWMIFQNIGYTHAEWAFVGADGSKAAGRLVWPFGSEYEDPKPIRICYPTVMLKDRRVYFLGVSDVVEPNKKWRAFKKKLTGRDWDYDFRRLFFTWSDDIGKGKFHPWIEIASREKTAGHVMPCDLWVDNRDRVHLLWIEDALDERLREAFFPNERQSHALHYAIARGGKLIHRRTLLLAEEGGAQERPTWARFHVLPEGRLGVVYYVTGRDAKGHSVHENRFVGISSDGEPGVAVRIPLEHPMQTFFTATVRAGSLPSLDLDLLGTSTEPRHAIRYAHVRLVRHTKP